MAKQKVVILKKRWLVRETVAMEMALVRPAIEIEEVFKRDTSSREKLVLTKIVSHSGAPMPTSECFIVHDDIADEEGRLTVGKISSRTYSTMNSMLGDTNVVRKRHLNYINPIQLISDNCNLVSTCLVLSDGVWRLIISAPIDGGPAALSYPRNAQFWTYIDRVAPNIGLEGSGEIVYTADRCFNIIKD